MKNRLWRTILCITRAVRTPWRKAKSLGKRTRLRLLVSCLAILATVTVIQWATADHSGQIAPKTIGYNEFEKLVKDKKIQKVIILGGTINGTLPDGKPFRVIVNTDYVKPVDELRQYGVAFSFKEATLNTNPRIYFALGGGVLILLAWSYLFFGGIDPYGRISLRFWVSPSKRFEKNKGIVTFRDVQGIDEAKAEVQEIVDFLKDPQKFQRLGGRIPKGVLLVGPPGNGKTLLARAIAGEANVPFFERSGSDFVEKFVGVGASRVRGLFNRGKAAGRCIIYIDEIDAVGAHRGSPTSGGDREYQHTTDALLTEMDGFDNQTGIVMIASTNKPEILDEALTRPGRFDRRVFVPRPNVRGREEILRVHVRKQSVPLGEDVDLAAIAQATQGFSGADLELIVNEAALSATRDEPKRHTVLARDFIFAKDKVLLGLEQKSRTRSAEELAVVEYHEAGHAFLAAILKGADPIEKVTIVARGMTGGGLYSLPSENNLYSRHYLLTQLVIMLGGRAAEQKFRGVCTNGAENDIERANEMAWHMVCKWGMSDLGPIAAHGTHTDLRTGQALNAPARIFSERKRNQIDAAIDRLVRDAEETALALLTKHEVPYRTLAALLHQKETVDGKEIYALAGKLRGSEKAF
ncbi:MAG TPA: ATP-dependent zinc metalloprotease FtsH [Candidatus Paceibacterota bacterium]|nr:ATP-dependent zinc metalloprotease FtsH [Candidatus Paceibacterota bacterium]